MNISTSMFRLNLICFLTCGIYLSISAFICRIIGIENYSVGLVVMPLAAIFINAKKLKIGAGVIVISHYWFERLSISIQTCDVDSCATENWFGFSLLRIKFKESFEKGRFVCILLSFYSKADQVNIIKSLNVKSG